VPELLTANEDWRKVYTKLEESYAKLRLKFNREIFIIDPCFFEMNPYFTGNQLDKPFPRTCKALQKFCRESNMKLKLELITEIMDSLRQDIELHQRTMIEKKEV